MRNVLYLCFELGVSACFAAVALAQNAAPPAIPSERPAAAPAAERNPTGGRADKILASCLLIDNQGEVQLAKFARDRAVSPDVKKFVETMVADHNGFINKLHPFAGGDAAAAKPAAAPNSPIAAPRAADAHAGAGHFDHLALKRELGDQCLKSTLAEFEKKQGREFEQCYMAQQIMMHQHMLDTLTVFSRHASPELQTVLKEGQQTTQQHLTHAKGIFERLDKDPPATARRPDADQPPRDR